MQIIQAPTVVYITTDDLTVFAKFDQNSGFYIGGQQITDQAGNFIDQEVLPNGGTIGGATDNIVIDTAAHTVVINTAACSLSIENGNGLTYSYTGNNFAIDLAGTCVNAGHILFDVNGLLPLGGNIGSNAGGNISIQVNNGSIIELTDSVADFTINSGDVAIAGAASITLGSTGVIALNSAVSLTVGSDVLLSAGKVLKVNNIQVIGSQQAAIINAAGGVVIDIQARTQLNLLLAACRTHGIIHA